MLSWNIVTEKQKDWLECCSSGVVCGQRLMLSCIFVLDVVPIRLCDGADNGSNGDFIPFMLRTRCSGVFQLNYLLVWRCLCKQSGIHVPIIHKFIYSYLFACVIIWYSMCVCVCVCARARALVYSGQETPFYRCTGNLLSGSINVTSDKRTT